MPTDTQIGAYALLALALFQGLSTALAVEQAVLPLWLTLLDAALVFTAAVCGWAILRGKAVRTALLVGLVAYLIVIAAHTLHEPKSLIGGFFLKVGVVGAVGYSLSKLSNRQRPIE